MSLGAEFGAVVVVVTGAVVVVAVVVDSVVVVVAVGRGMNLDLNVFTIGLDGCPRSRIQPARTTSRQRIVGYNECGVIVNVNTDDGELLSVKPFGWPTGHSRPNERCTARTRSLNRTVTFSLLIEIETTRGAALRTCAAPKLAIQERPIPA